MPHSVRKFANVVREKTGERNAVKSTVALASGSGFNRDLMSRLTGIRDARCMNPATRHAQGNPILGINCWNTKGNTIPPTDPPEIAKPVAFARLSRNQCPMAAMDGVNKREAERPPKT